MKTTRPAGAGDYRQWVQMITRALAPGWERQRARIEAAAAPVRGWLVGELAPRLGDIVLELAAGVGDTGFEVASLVGDSGRLISTDVSAAMVDVARRRGAELGLRNVEYLAVDAEHIELASGSVDGVICRFGYMLMADPAAALYETRRVLRSGRRLVLAVWGAPGDNPWVTTLGRALVEHGHVPPPDPGAPGAFSLADQPTLRKAVEDAGFAAVRVEEVPVTFAFRDASDYLAFTTETSPFGPVLKGLSGGERNTIEAELAAAFAPFTTDDGCNLPGVALVAVAS